MIKILITGAKGQVGSAVCLRAEKLGMAVVAFDAQTLDIAEAHDVRQVIATHQPNYVINCASYSVVDIVESNPEKAQRINVKGASVLATECELADTPLLHLSTDYVFSGKNPTPINEQANANPVNVFGKSKWEGECEVVRNCSRHIILRVGWIFSSRGNNFAVRTWNQILNQPEVVAVDDQYGCPTDAVDTARVLLAIVQQLDCGVEAWGIYHYSGAEVVTWKGFADAILAAVKHLPNTQAQAVVGVTSSDWPTKATRPNYSVLDCTKVLDTFGIKQRPWRVGLVKVIATLSAS